jgi:hypothetical protein
VKSLKEVILENQGLKEQGEAVSLAPSEMVYWLVAMAEGYLVV